MKTTIENNKLIAEFKGYQSNGKGLVFQGIEGQYYEDRLYFHSSWDWLMPVVHKCLLICHNNMLNEWEVGFSDAFFSMSIETLLKEVLAFIEFYNEEKNNLI